ncbi:hypothetical protein H8L32_10725 [Undibacterium sp. CY18W]|uniref:Immunity protein 53 n=1 Tax=Undibacterium hunanense TaxID=2762292 RepID=A0ABR6ZQ57_9BURK|nr:hypothetical protein [Undibacterium hunanense]MBC3917949.1 hypothetical protein [Undibacterium hunanense]
MNHFEYFEEFVKPKIPGDYLLTWSDFPNGDFGDLKRAEFASSSLLGSIEFWSKGWLGVDVVDLRIDDQVLVILCSPEDEDGIKHAFDGLLEILVDV